MVVDRKDKEWVASLTNNRAGRCLASHLASMELCDQADGRDCAVTEAVANERVFVYAIARAVYQSRPYPFGFSAALPRFIAILITRSCHMHTPRIPTPVWKQQLSPSHLKPQVGAAAKAQASSKGSSEQQRR